MLGALSASDRAAYFRQSQVDPAYQQWRQQAMHDPNAAARLAALGDQAAAAPSDAATAAAHQAARASCGWCCSSRRRRSYCCGWPAAGPPARPPPARHPVSPAARATRFRVGQTIPLDPAPFLLAAGVTKVQPPPAGGMISVEAVGLLEDAGVRLHRLYLPGRTAFFQLHLGADGAPDECRYFSRLDEVQSGQPGRVGRVARSGAGNDRLAGVPDQGRQDLRSRVGARTEPGSRRVSRPRRYRRSAAVTQRQLQAMLYAGPTGAAPPAPQGEYVMVAAVEDGGQAWVEIHAGIDVNPASLTLPPVPL